MTALRTWYVAPACANGVPTLAGEARRVQTERPSR